VPAEVPDLDAVHSRLREILLRHAASMTVSRDDAAGMTLELPGSEGKPWGYVAGTRVGKRYVSYYLMSVYGQPDLLGSLSPGLRRRMQGKSCFNFTTVDEPLFAELETLTEKGIARHPEMVAASPRRR
jgi:hypothetical protein